MTPQPSKELIPEQTLPGLLDELYNTAIDHAIAIVEEELKPGHIANHALVKVLHKLNELKNNP